MKFYGFLVDFNEYLLSADLISVCIFKIHKKNDSRRNFNFLKEKVKLYQ